MRTQNFSTENAGRYDCFHAKKMWAVYEKMYELDPSNVKDSKQC